MEKLSREMKKALDACRVANDKMAAVEAAIDGRYFVKDDNGKWFGVMNLSFEDV